MRLRIQAVRLLQLPQVQTHRGPGRCCAYLDPASAIEFRDEWRIYPNGFEMNIVRAIKEAVVDHESLEGVLAQLQRMGKPRLGMYGDDGTWSCNVDMFVNATGAEFKVRSEFDCKTPMQAARQCLERAQKASRT